jgi:hypothetical protein
VGAARLSPDSQWVATGMVTRLHGISRPSFVKDRYEPYLRWYRQHLSPKTP